MDALRCLALQYDIAVAPYVWHWMCGRHIFTGTRGDGGGGERRVAGSTRHGYPPNIAALRSAPSPVSRYVNGSGVFTARPSCAYMMLDFPKRRFIFSPTCAEETKEMMRMTEHATPPLR